MREITMGSLFSGLGGFELASVRNGIRPVWNSDIEPYVIAVTRNHFPNTRHVGSVTEISGAELEPVDIITFGSPCFPAGTLILTSIGYIPIEDVRIGHEVLTHMGRWRKVTAIGNKETDETVLLRGNHFGLECTPNHPIYSAEEGHDYTRKSNGKRVNRRVLKENRFWIRAEDMLGRLWASPRAVDPLPRDMNCGFAQNDSFWYLSGRYIGDGWTSKDLQSVHICDGLSDMKELIEAVRQVTTNFRISKTRTSARVTIRSSEFANWLHRTFGKYASGKFIAPWVFGIDEKYRNALLRGIFDSDGNEIKNGYNVATVSESLAYGIRLLGEMNGWSSRIHKTVVNGRKAVIEGREVNQRDWYAIRFIENYDGRAKAHLYDGTHSWYRVKGVEHRPFVQTVYNLTVEEDNSYVANSIVVHNCQDLSVAGKQAGIHEGARSSLFFEAIRIIREMREKDIADGRADQFIRPRFAVWENVPGAYSSNKGKDFQSVLQAFCEIRGGAVPYCTSPSERKVASCRKHCGKRFLACLARPGRRWLGRTPA